MLLLSGVQELPTNLGNAIVSSSLGDMGDDTEHLSPMDFSDAQSCFCPLSLILHTSRLISDDAGLNA